MLSQGRQCCLLGPVSQPSPSPPGDGVSRKMSGSPSTLSPAPLSQRGRSAGGTGPVGMLVWDESCHSWATNAYRRGLVAFTMAPRAGEISLLTLHQQRLHPRKDLGSLVLLPHELCRLLPWLVPGDVHLTRDVHTYKSFEHNPFATFPVLQGRIKACSDWGQSLHPGQDPPKVGVGKLPSSQPPCLSVHPPCRVCPLQHHRAASSNAKM